MVTFSQVFFAEYFSMASAINAAVKCQVRGDQSKQPAVKDHPAASLCSDPTTTDSARNT